MVIQLFFYFCVLKRMNQKVSRNGKQKSSNEEKLVLGEYESTSIAQEDDSNSFELLQNLWLNNLRFIILKCSRFCFYFTVYTNVLNIVVFMVRKGKKKQSKGQHPPPRTISFLYIFSTTPTIPHTPSIRDLRAVGELSTCYDHFEVFRIFRIYLAKQF